MTTLSVTEEIERLQARVLELEHERRHLVAIVEIQQEISGSLHFVDIMQAIARRLGEAFGLDRASIFLAERNGATARLVASFEDPSIRNYVVDLNRYPELRRSMRDGVTVHIPDVEQDAAFAHLKTAMGTRRVGSLTVVPINWRRASIGAIMLRTFRDGTPFSEGDVRFCEAVANLTARALRNAHRYERLQQRVAGHPVMTTADRERATMVAFLRRLLDEFAARSRTRGEESLPRASADEVERLVGVALTVIQQEASSR
ncbi:MAG: GAF domain-containing protein [Gemmatimonadota bacterium]|nr:GAF domain-containing protein [Gemmatimonadota bacterium]